MPRRPNDPGFHPVGPHKHLANAIFPANNHEMMGNHPPTAHRPHHRPTNGLIYESALGAAPKIKRK